MGEDVLCAWLKAWYWRGGSNQSAPPRIYAHRQSVAPLADDGAPRLLATWRRSRVSILPERHQQGSGCDYPEQITQDEQRYRRRIQTDQRRPDGWYGDDLAECGGADERAEPERHAPGRAEIQQGRQWQEVEHV